MIPQPSRGDADKRKKLIEEVSKNPLLFNQLSEEQQDDKEILKGAITPNSDGIYSYHPFSFIKDEEQDVEQESEEIKQQTEEFGKCFNKISDIEIFHKLGEGSFGRAYLFRFRKGISSISEESFVLKLSKCVYSGSLKRESLYLPYHRNIAPVVYHCDSFKIKLTKLPDYEESWKGEELGKDYSYKVNAIVLKYHRKDLEKYVKERVEIHKPFLNVEFSNILRGILRGVKYLHSLKIVHRDLHPMNIFVSEAYGRVWIGDFGCSLDLRNNNKGFVVHMKDEILYSSLCSYFIRGGYADVSGYNNCYERFLAPEILEFDIKTQVCLDYSKSDLYSVGMIGKFMIKKFYINDKFKLKNLEEEFLSRKIVSLIESLLVENPKKRIGFSKSVNQIEVLVENFEREQGEVNFDFDPFKDYNDIVSQSRKYFSEGDSSQKYGKFHQGVKCYEKCLQLLEGSDKGDHNRMMFDCYYNVGKCKRDIGEYDSSLKNYQKALGIILKFFSDDYEWISKCYGRIGWIYLQQKEYQKAENNLRERLHILQKNLSQNQSDIASSFGNLAFYYQKTKDFQKAQEYYLKCLNIQKKLVQNEDQQELIRIDLTHYYMGLLYEDTKEFSKSSNCYQKSLEIAVKKLPKNHPDISKFSKKIFEIGGIFHNKLRDYSKALDCFLKSLKIQERVSSPKNRDLLIRLYRSIGSVYCDMKMFSKALEYFEKGLPELQPNVNFVSGKI